MQRNAANGQSKKEENRESKKRIEKVSLVSGSRNVVAQQGVATLYTGKRAPGGVTRSLAPCSATTQRKHEKSQTISETKKEEKLETAMKKYKTGEGAENREKKM